MGNNDTKVINLNMYKKREFISKEAIIKNLDSLDIFRYYINKDFKIGRAISSPLRDDEIPSFAIFKNDGAAVGSYNEFLFNDFVLGGGDCFRFVKLLFNYSSWFDILSRIAIDFSLDKKYIVNKSINKLKNHSQIQNYRKNVDIKKLKLSIKTRSWERFDDRFWKEYGISRLTLSVYDVYPISHIFLNSNTSNEIILPTDKYAYAFQERKDGKYTYKIYQPFSKEHKWFSSHNNTIWQGWQNLPKDGDYLIITKSLKDVMSITENIKIPAIALQSEKTTPKDKVMEELSHRFEHIFLLYDNDYNKKENWGQLFAKKLQQKYLYLHNICIPNMYESKDFTDLVKSLSDAKTASNIIKSILQEKINNEIPFK